MLSLVVAGERIPLDAAPGDRRETKAGEPGDCARIDPASCELGCVEAVGRRFQETQRFPLSHASARFRRGDLVPLNGEAGNPHGSIG